MHKPISLLLLIIPSTLAWMLPAPFSITHCPTHRSPTRLSGEEDDWDMFETDDLDIPEDLPEEDELSYEDLQAYLGDWDERVPQFNTVHLTGRVGNVPEPRYLDDGKVVVNLSLACTPKIHYLERKHHNIAYGDEGTDWYGLEIWGQTAEYVTKYIDKGARVGVIGTLQIDEWTDKATGELRNRVKVIVREFELLETKAEAELRRSRNKGGGGKSYSSGKKRQPNNYNDDDDEDLYRPNTGGAGNGGFFD